MAQDILHSKTAHGDRAPSCTIVIFGAGGDLTKRLLMPALYNLARTQLLPDKFCLIGVDRLELTDGAFRKHVEDAIRAFAADKHYTQTLDEKHLQTLLSSLHYLSADFSDPPAYKALETKLKEQQHAKQLSQSVMFYLAVGARFFGGIVDQLGNAGLVTETNDQWRRVVVEKPFGHNLESAQALNTQLRHSLAETQIYRMDHFLGKETVQNIMLMRFANGIFEPLWNRDHIDHIQITVAETVGVEKRAAFYETTGAMRDMVPNHILQLLSLVAMEPPTSFEAEAVREEKAKVLRAIAPMTPERVLTHAVRGQYGEGLVDGKKVPGYRQEERVPLKSGTETYVGMQLSVDNWRWADVPFYVRVGKRLPKGGTEIAVQFKSVPPVLFRATGETVDDNVLVIRIQPDEGISLRMCAKMPGSSLRIEPVKMDFHYGTSFGKATPEAYERLLLDAMSGDATLFARRDEVEEAWKFIDSIHEAWRTRSNDLAIYSAGSWGPSEADELIKRHEATWRRL